MSVASRRPRMTAVLREEERVTPLELFFDLVFVFAITQVTVMLADDATWAGLDWASAPPDEQLPAIGEAFTDRVEIRCGG